MGSAIETWRRRQLVGQATFKLAKQFNGVTHYAEATITARFDESLPPVTISPAVFAWLRDDYGPDAYEWAVCVKYREEGHFSIVGGANLDSSVPGGGFSGFGGV
jgi:hypothetical protein